MGRVHARRKRLAGVLLVAFLTAGMTASAGPLDQTIAVELPAQPLDKALRELAKSSGIQLMFNPSLVAGRQAPPISGVLAVREVLLRLLQDTGLEAYEESPGVLVIRVTGPADASQATTSVPAGALPEKTTRSEGSEPVALEEVVVTAQRREQTLQEVPISLTAIDRSQIEARNVQSARDLSGTAPGLVMTPEIAYSQGPRIFIRGMGTASSSISRPSPVGVYLNGVYIGGNAGNILNLVDLERVEVLRGPQGTLYGRNSMAGTINMVASRPSGELTGYASLDFSNYNGLVQKISTDLPKVGIARVSVSAYSNQRDGWVHASDRGFSADVSDINDRSLRLDGLLEFSPDFTAEYTFDRSNAHTNGAFLQLLSADDAFFNRFGFQSVSQYASNRRLTKASIDGNQFWRQQTGGHSLTLEWQVNDNNTLKSITGYREFETFANPDEDGTPYGIVIVSDPIPAGLSVWSGFDPKDPIYEYNQWSQELQWVGRTENLDYVAGLYYFSSGGNAAGTSSYFGLTHTLSAYEIGDESFAIYGQVDYQPIDQLTLTAGLRTNFDKAKLDNLVYGCRQPGAYCTPPPGSAFSYVIPPGAHGSETFEGTLPVYALNWKFSDQLNVYARYAEGYLAGGFNTGAGSTSKPPEANVELALTPFKPQKSESLEIGAKTTLFDGRFQGSASLSRTDYTNLQQAVFLPAANSSVLIRNAASATITAAELEGAFMVVPGTTVSANYAWLDPEYNQFIEGDPVTGEPRNFADNRSFGHSPRHSFGVAVDSRLAHFGWGALQAHADYRYQSDMYMTSGTQLKSSGPDYAAPNNVLDFGPNFGNLRLATFTPPVTYGLKGTLRW